MKKLFVFAASVAVLFGSCKKYEASEPLELKNLPKVTLAVSVFADLDETNAIMEAVPDNSNLVTVSVPYSDYDINNLSGGDYVIVAKEVKLEQASDSKSAIRTYYFDVPVISSGVKATVAFEDFTYDVKKIDAATGIERTTLKRFACPSEDIFIANSGAGEHKRIDARYASSEINPNDNQNFVPTGKVNVSGKIEYLSDDTTWRMVPTGTEISAVITLYDAEGRTYTESRKITINAGGAYSIEVPMVERGNATVKLYAENFWTYTTLATNKRAIYRYELNATIGGIYNYPNQSGKDYKYNKTAHVQDEL